MMKHLKLTTSTAKVCSLSFTALVYGTAAQSAVAQEQVTQIMAVNAKGLTQCRSMTDSLERLVCYDQLADSLSNAQPVRPLAKQPSRPEPTIVAPDVDAPIVAPPVVAPATPLADTESPATLKPSFDSKDFDKLVSPILRWETSARGRSTFLLRNGQIWQQSDNRKLFKPNDFTPGSANAAVSKASLGSFLLRVNDRGTAIRVKYVE